MAQTPGDQAQTGSIYSKIGVGMPVDFTSSSADGMGALGVSFNETNVAGLANPATWGNMACFEREGMGCFALASGGFSLEHVQGTDNLGLNGSSGRTESSVFSANHFQLQLPVKKNRIGISASITPLTRSNYSIIGRNTWASGPGGQVDTATVRNVGSGGINSLELGFGWEINRNISVGYAGSLVLASMEKDVTTVFQESGYQTVEYSMQTSGTGFGNRFGALITLPNVLKQRDYLRIGAAVNLPVVIDAKRTQKSEKQLGTNTIETVTVSDGQGLGSGELRLPLELSGGLTYQINPRLSFTTEALYEQWSDFGYDFNSGLRKEEQLGDRYKAAFGIRYFPFVSGSNKFLSRFKYRAGVSYDTGHLNIDGKKIETILFSAGLGVPSPNSNSSVDISFHYGLRGTEAQNLVKESIWGVKLSINLAELVFSQPKLQ
ncbi:outer membrane protein transport protein [Aliifodinibius sp. S!AR15-10]|uniref:OmpP1/FadL family transporter n=1 Tax=Aliifodinibius sp. S!AR15-10 TaxID=2950437 RepID=UPI00286034A4|nr:outer membrane protein transport protein [Aliifodinibius sp. S!AR15-10]MDR8392979.1 outer membrane protein transport protein [Aliifodinibius sp. S!AR15-10]